MPSRQLRHMESLNIFLGNKNFTRNAEPAIETQNFRSFLLFLEKLYKECRAGN